MLIKRLFALSVSDSGNSVPICDNLAHINHY